MGSLTLASLMFSYQSCVFSGEDFEGHLIQQQLQTVDCYTQQTENFNGLCGFLSNDNLMCGKHV